MNEDSVTGSMDCKFTPYWAKKLGKNNFLAYQASKRGGELLLQLEGKRILLTGKAQIFSEGKLLNTI